MPYPPRRCFWAAPILALLMLAACEGEKKPAELPPPEDGFYLRATSFDARR